MDRKDVSGHLKHEMSRMVRIVCEFERDVALAAPLLKRLHRETLTGAEWQALFSLLADIRPHEARFKDRCGRLPESGAINSDAERDLHQLLWTLEQRLSDTRSRLYSIDPPWEGVIRRIATTLPYHRAGAVVVHSRVVPGAALGAHFARGYPAELIANPHSLEQFRHLHGLEQTVLTNADGRTLFSGLRHNSIRVHELNEAFLGRLPDEDLKTLFFDYFANSSGSRERSDPACERELRDNCARVRTNRQEMIWLAAMMRGIVFQELAAEIVVAALASDPVKLQHALHGETVSLNLFAILLQEQDCPNAWNDQSTALGCLKLPQTIKLGLRGPNGDLRNVQADVNVRQFLLPARPRSMPPDPHVDPQIPQLFGPLDTLKLGGTIKAQVEAMRSCSHAMCKQLRWPIVQSHQTTQVLGTDHPERLPVANRVGKMKNESHHLQKNANTLEDAGRQLKAMWMEREQWPGDVRGRRKAAARLALLGHLMGETPLLICSEDSDLARRLDAPIKFLATAADNLNGRLLPPLDRNAQLWKPTRRDFKPH